MTNCKHLNAINLKSSSKNDQPDCSTILVVCRMLCFSTRLLMKLLLTSKTRSLFSDVTDRGSILSELSRSSNTSKLYNLQHH